MKCGAAPRKGEMKMSLTQKTLLGVAALSLVVFASTMMMPTHKANGQTIIDLQDRWTDRNEIIEAMRNDVVKAQVAWEGALFASFTRGDLTGAQALAIITDVEVALIGANQPADDPQYGQLRELKERAEEEGRTVNVSRTDGAITVTISAPVIESPEVNTPE
jgi:hypothetical protein